MEKKVTYAEAILVEEIKGLKDLNRRILVAGNRSGGVAVAAMRRWPDAEVVAHAFDFHHARAIRKRLLDEGLPARNVRCSAGVGTVGTDPMPSVGTDPMPLATAECQPFDVAFFMTTPQSMPAELVLDQLQDIHLNLAEGGALYAAFEGDPDEALKTIRLVWKNVNVLKRAKHAVLFRAVKRGVPVKTRDFAATWEASVPGGEPLTFTTYPGCFCHRRPDAGGLALAEVAAREGNGERGTGNGEWKILDMGCGCGLVGLLVADAIRRQSSISNPQSSILNPQSSILNPQSSILKPQASSLKTQDASFKTQAARLKFQNYTFFRFNLKFVGKIMHFERECL